MQPKTRPEEKKIIDPVVEDKQALYEALLKKQELIEGLPHIHRFKFYPWSRAFWETTNHMSLLCSGNQVGKSTLQMRKCIHWATNQEIWPELWRAKPTQFWYLYPTKEVASIEFEEKWMKLLPQGKYKDDPVYGWKDEWDGKDIFSIKFKSGVTVYFKAYSQKAQHLQSGTVDALYCDEELPSALYDELIFRLAASNGYFSMVFTATLGQPFWDEAIEVRGVDKGERFPDAFKLQVSMYDCLFYEDGTQGVFTERRIQQIINECKNEKEVQRRVWGRFVKEDGLRFPTFTRRTCMVPEGGVPKGWKIYSGVDPGSGGDTGHPAAICFVAVDPEYKKGIAYCGWRGDKISTTASDILEKYRELRGHYRVLSQKYDHACKDFFTIASRVGEAFIPADKDRKKGIDIINVLFKNGRLKIYDTPQLQKLASELCNIQENEDKRWARDDLCDALRYAISDIPWNFSDLEGFSSVNVKITPVEKTETQRRRDFVFGDDRKKDFMSIEAEMREINEFLDV